MSICAANNCALADIIKAASEGAAFFVVRK